MTPRIELVYDRDCPNAAEARANLVRALVAAEVPVRWTEWDRGNTDTPERVRGFGSPAILVDGKEITGTPFLPDGAGCCRLYSGPGGVRLGAPPVTLIARAIAQDESPPPAGTAARRKTVFRFLPVLPAALVALLPKLACPACWPAYSGLLGAAGLGFLASAAWLLPLTGVFLAGVLGVLAWGGRRRGWGPLALGIAASAAILSGKFLLGSNPVLFGGVGLLVLASLWNSWPRLAAPGACPSCPPGGKAGHVEGTSGGS